MTPPERVLAADDEPEDLERTATLLREEGLAVETAPSGAQAADKLLAQRFALVVTDLVMPGVSGFELIAAAHKADPETICIAMTSFGSLDSALDALRMGAYGYLVKPCDPETFRHTVRRGLEKRRLTAELRERNRQLEALNRELDAKVQQATSDLRELNRQVLTQMAGLQEVDRLKTAFLDNVSHDLKSPLSTIGGYAEVLLAEAGPSLSQEHRKGLQSMHRAAIHMEYLISQLVEAAKLTQGQIRLDLKPTQAAELLEEAATLIRAQAQRGEIKLEVRHRFAAGDTLLIDRGRMLQVLSNLLGNACKFTPRGGQITLEGWKEGDAVRFSVADTGIGIAPEHHEKVFEKFFQVDTSRSRTYKGLGLGLRIAKDIVALHGGRIWVESTLGKGSCFHVQIPLAGLRA